MTRRDGGRLEVGMQCTVVRVCRICYSLGTCHGEPRCLHGDVREECPVRPAIRLLDTFVTHLARRCLPPHS